MENRQSYTEIEITGIDTGTIHSGMNDAGKNKQKADAGAKAGGEE